MTEARSLFGCHATLTVFIQADYAADDAGNTIQNPGLSGHVNRAVLLWVLWGEFGGGKARALVVALAVRGSLSGLGLFSLSGLSIRSFKACFLVVSLYISPRSSFLFLFPFLFFSVFLLLPRIISHYSPLFLFAVLSTPDSQPCFDMTTMAKAFSKDEVSSHSKPDNLWVVIDEDVFDLTQFQEEHPGGKKSMYREEYSSRDINPDVQA